MPTIRTLARFACIVAICAQLHAQDAKLITVQLRDGKTGAPITPSNFLLRVDHFDTIHSEWVKIYDNGTVLVRVPDDANVVSLQATYGSGMSTYINCDAAKQKDKEKASWYPIDLILKSGLVAPNECGKTQYSAKPGEFIFFVRKRNALDNMRNPDSD